MQCFPPVRMFFAEDGKRLRSGSKAKSAVRFLPKESAAGARIGAGRATHHRHRKTFVEGLLLACAVGLICLTPSAGRAGSDAPPEALSYLEHMARFLADAPVIKVTMTTAYDVLQESGEMVAFGERRRVTIARPDRMRVETEQSDGKNALLVFDGKTLAFYSASHKAFAQAEHPGDLDGALTYFLQDLKMRLPLALMFSAGFPEELQARLRSAAWVETDALTDVPCVHLAARTDQVDFQVWIPASGDPLPRRVIITYRHEAAQPQFRADFTNWDLTSKPAAADFHFAPPQDAERIPFQGQLAQNPPPTPSKGGQ